MSTELANQIADLADANGISPIAIVKLPDILTAAGIDPTTVNEDLLAKADRLFREQISELLKRHHKPVVDPTATNVENSPSPARSDKKASKSPKTTKSSKTANSRVQVLGYSPTAILRWMGKNNWKPDAAATALATLGAGKISDTTIKIQLKAGRDGERGDPAPITKSQATTLRKASK